MSYPSESYGPTRVVGVTRLGSSVDFGFFLALFVFICLSPAIRLYGGALFVAFLLVACLYVVVKNALFYRHSIAIFTATGILYVLLSYLDALPDAWTTIYDSSTILRQGFFVFAFYPLVAAARELWKHVLSSRHAAKYFLALLVASVPVARIVGWALSDGEDFVLFRLSGLGNQMLPVYLAVGYLVFVRLGKMGRLLALPVGAALFLPTSFLQNQLVSLAFVGLAWVRRFKWPLIVAVLAGFVVTGVGLFMIPEYRELEMNLGVRLLFLRDAFTALWESAGLGVGFGKEAVTNQFVLLWLHLFVDPFSPFSTDINFMYLSLHNSFAAMFYRLGLVGGAAFAWFFLVDCFPRGIANPQIARHASFVFFTAFMAVFANVAIESPAYIVAVAFACGHVLACKDLYGASSERGATGRRPLPRGLTVPREAG